VKIWKRAGAMACLLLEAAFGQSAKDLAVIAGKSMIIDSPVNIERISMADENVAAAQVTNPRELVVNGKIPGQTSLIVWQQGGTRLLFDLTVLPNPAKPQVLPEGASRPVEKEFQVQSPNAIRKGRILILEGDGVQNSISSKTAISPVVQVLNEQGRPVANAEVVFVAPPTGPGGQFGMAPMAKTRTDRTGQATARFTPNEVSGRFAIQVKATWETGTAEASVVQYNDANLSMPALRVAKRPWYRDWRVWAAAGGAAGIGTWLGQRNGGGGKSVITIIPSPVGIGGGR